MLRLYMFVEPKMRVPRKKGKEKKGEAIFDVKERTEADGQYVRKFRSSTVSRFENLVRKVISIIKKLPAPIMPSKAKDGVKWVPDGWANACMRLQVFKTK